MGAVCTGCPNWIVAQDAEEEESALSKRFGGNDSRSSTSKFVYSAEIPAREAQVLGSTENSSRGRDEKTEMFTQDAGADVAGDESPLMSDTADALLGGALMQHMKNEFEKREDALRDLEDALLKKKQDTKSSQKLKEEIRVCSLKTKKDQGKEEALKCSTDSEGISTWKKQNTLDLADNIVGKSQDTTTENSDAERGLQKRKSRFNFSEDDSDVLEESEDEFVRNPSDFKSSKNNKDSTSDGYKSSDSEAVFERRKGRLKFERRKSRFNSRKDLRTLQGNEMKRHMAILELIETEQHFLKQLKLINSLFLVPLREKGFIDEGSSIAPMEAIVDDLIEGSLWLCRSLAKAHSILEVFHMPKMKDIMKIFSKYLDHFDAWSVFIDDFPNTKKGAKFLKERRSPDGIFITPIQRPPRYLLLLEEMRKRTPPTHQAYEDLLTAIELVGHFVEYFNSHHTQESLRRHLSIRLDELASDSEFFQRADSYIDLPGLTLHDIGSFTDMDNDDSDEPAPTIGQLDPNLSSFIRVPKNRSRTPA